LFAGQGFQVLDFVLHVQVLWLVGQVLRLARVFNMRQGNGCRCRTYETDRFL
jgi:hypothetical protein